jgi:hypothetical protein
MTFIVVVPNAGQSPGLFPSQANANFQRLETIITGDHVFNASAAPNDGLHKQVTLVNRIDPVGLLPSGTNSMVYGKTASDSVNELWFYDAITPRQLNWRQLSGIVAVTTSIVGIAAIPPNCYGEIFLMLDLTGTGKQNIIQAGTFVSNGSKTYGYSYAEKAIVGSGAQEILRLDLTAANGLILGVSNQSV